MSHLDTELNLLKQDIQEMMRLVRNQMAKSKEALFNFDTDLAHEITANERRINALELKIDRDCENILALFNPVAIDLRFTLAAFKINSDLERVADHADNIADYILDMNEPIDPDLFEKMHMEEMYDNAVQMLDHVFQSYMNEDTDLARKVFKKDHRLNEINRDSSKFTTELIHEDMGHTPLYLYLFSIIRKLERVGDLTKNIAEELIFYIEAKVLKHQKLKNKEN